MKKSCLFIFLFLMLFATSLIYCEGGKEISDVKSEEWKEYVGRKLRLEGYFVDRPVPMLVTSMRLIDINAPIPEEKYIRLTGEGIKGLSPEKFYGAYVRVSGRIQISDDKETQLMTNKLGDLYAIEFTCGSVPRILLEREEGIIIPQISNICERYPLICKLLFAKPQRYAILLSGGVSSASAHMRYWNDLKFMYLTLRSKYGFTDENIIVVYKDGNAEDTDIVVDYAADFDGIEDAFADISDQISEKDLFFFFATNHGGGFLMHDVAGYNAGNFGGRIDDSGDETDEAIFEEHLNSDLNNDGDTIDQVRYDDRIYLYNSRNDLWDDDFADFLSDITCDKMVIVLEPCFSGGNIADIRGKNRIIISAASEYEFSWGMGDYDAFSYYFTAALNWAEPDGTAVDADTNDDDKVSIVEAFEYACANDTTEETPWYEESTDGRGHTSPLPNDGDGLWGANVFLD